MAYELTGAAARRPGWIVKSRLRDFIKAQLLTSDYAPNYAEFQGVDVRIVNELEDELPKGQPLITIGRAERKRKPFSDGSADLTFTLELRVLADINSGGLMAAPDKPALIESLSDDLDDLLTRDGAEAALYALGLTELAIGTRREVSERGIHINRHTVTLCVSTTPL